MPDRTSQAREESRSRPATSSQAPDSARRIAQSLLDIEAVKLRPSDPFTWSSGLVSPIYCDNRLTISVPPVRREIRNAFADLLAAEEFLPATIAGTATAGIPHAAWLAEAVDQPMVYVRSSAKDHGTGARIEGQISAGDEVVLVEDLISTGGSALDAVAALQERGARVHAVLAIFTYQLEAAETAFQEAGVKRFVLSDFQTLIDVAHTENRLSDDELTALQHWRADPEAWSVEHGGARPE